MKEFGVHLKNAREAAELSLNDIHESTRISIKNLRLIESGDFPSIPQTYVRAFVREYARAVGLDEDETLAYYNEAAEREKGIPRPPENIDSSNLHIKVDDTIEYIEPLDRPPSHVEVEGTAEVAPDDYVPPVRKSRYVDEDSGTPIDIRTTAATPPPEKKAEALSPPERKSTPKEQAPARAENAPEVFQEGPHRKDASGRDDAGSGPVSSADTPPTEEAQPPAAPADTSALSEISSPGSEKSPAASKDIPEASGKSPASEPRSPAAPEKSSVSPEDISRDSEQSPAAQPKSSPAQEKSSASQEDISKDSEKSPAASAADRSASKTSGTRDSRGESKTPSAAPPPPASPGIVTDSPNEKRIIGVGLVTIAIIVIAVYGIFYFGSDDDADSALVDSTAIKASIEAGRFIDSSQYALTEIDLPAEDTIPAEALTPPEPVESKPRVFERSDSLVLEAFTSAPVWFSVKMDTLRTERGSLSSKEHRVWKAREYFIITLGDAGAVTFFLNGQEIGRLGEEGAVVKNVTLSRRQLEGN